MWDHFCLTARRFFTSEPEAILTECVFLTCFDQQFLSWRLRQSQIELHQAATLEEADFLLTVTSASGLLCDPAFLDGNWRDAWQMVVHYHPSAVLLLVVDQQDLGVAVEARELRAVEVLHKPLDVSLVREALAGVHREPEISHQAVVPDSGPGTNR